MSSGLLPERQEGESQKAYTAFLDYCRMGAGRSLRQLAQTYSEPTASNPPTKTERTLFDWSSHFQWQDRVAAYDAAIASERETRLAEKRQQVEDDELTDYERELVEWRRRFDLLSLSPNGMNTFEIAQFFKLRKEIADLGRRAVGLPDKLVASKSEVTGADGGPIKVTDGLTDDERSARIAALFDAARARRTG